MVRTGRHGFNYRRGHEYVSSPDLQESRGKFGKIFSEYRWLHHNNVFPNTALLLLSMSAKSADLTRCHYTPSRHRAWVQGVTVVHRIRFMKLYFGNSSKANEHNSLKVYKKQRGCNSLRLPAFFFIRDLFNKAPHL